MESRRRPEEEEATFLRDGTTFSLGGRKAAGSEGSARRSPFSEKIKPINLLESGIERKRERLALGWHRSSHRDSLSLPEFPKNVSRDPSSMELPAMRLPVRAIRKPLAINQPSSFLSRVLRESSTKSRFSRRRSPRFSPFSSDFIKHFFLFPSQWKQRSALNRRSPSRGSTPGPGISDARSRFFSIHQPLLSIL